MAVEGGGEARGAWGERPGRYLTMRAQVGEIHVPLRTYSSALIEGLWGRGKEGGGPGGFEGTDMGTNSGMVHLCLRDFRGGLLALRQACVGVVEAPDMVRPPSCVDPQRVRNQKRVGREKRGEARQQKKWICERRALAS